MLTQREVCACAWQTILWHGAAHAEAAAEERIVELRAAGLIAGAEMWVAIKARIPELLERPEIWDELPQ